MDEMEEMQEDYEPLRTDIQVLPDDFVREVIAPKRPRVSKVSKNGT